MCTSTGRKCEYRETSDRRTRASRAADKPVRLEIDVSPGTSPEKNCFSGPLIPLVLPGQVDLTPDERWYLDYFRKSTSIQCATYFYDEFWQRLVHQACDNQPAVRHAAIGMGALNWEFLKLRLGRDGPLDRSVSLQQTNKAIACLRRNLKNDRMGSLRVEVALISCIILVNVVLFQEGVDAAGRHLRSGFKLLEHYLSDNAHRSTVGPILQQVFSNSHLMWSTFTDPGAFVEDDDAAFRFPVPERYPAPMNNDEKESNFVTTLSRLVIQSNSRGFSSGPATSVLNKEPPVVLFKLRTWKSQMKGAFALRKDHVPHRDLEALTVFELWDAVLRVIFAVETQPPPREMKYDGVVETFRKAIEIAKALLTFSSDFSPMPVFCIRKGVIPPLFFCAFRCRDWFIRRDALKLLQQWRKRDGVSTVSATTLVLERLVELESKGLTSADVVPEASRIESVIVEIPPRASKLHLRYRRARSSEINVMSQTDAMPWESEWLPYQADRDI